MIAGEINIRDPFVLPDHDKGKYYMYGTRGLELASRGKGFDVYVASELDGEWDGPHEVFDAEKYGMHKGPCWAPEVYLWKSAYYMFATFNKDNGMKGTFVLRSDSPMGPFKPHSDGAVTPYEWESLDGSLYISPEGKPYMVFCHEWIQINHGTICAVGMTDDLSAVVGQPFLLLEAVDAPWIDKNAKTLVTDGPFMHRLSDGRLAMIWSSFCGDYVQAVAISSGGIEDKFEHLPELLFSKDGGHGMIFADNQGNLNITMHVPNKNRYERPVFYKIKEDSLKGFTII